MKEEILKSTIAALNPKFIHRENILQNFLSEIRYMEEEIRNYYVKGSYNNNNVRDVWLEDLNETPAYGFLSILILVLLTSFCPTVACHNV